jgi:hypothetical protein
MASIPLSQLEEMFQNMQTEAGWDTDHDLLWGYFFTDRDPGNLRPPYDGMDVGPVSGRQQ